jgi:hypothetical protein
VVTLPRRIPTPIPITHPIPAPQPVSCRLQMPVFPEPRPWG